MLGYIPGGKGYQPFNGGGGGDSDSNTKAACKLATTANITLSGLQTIDGVMTVAGDRILVKNQTPDIGSGNPANGIYLADAGAWTRTTDANTWNELVGAFVFITSGSTLASTGWRCTIAPGGIIDINNISWAQVSGVGTYTASNGVQLIGNDFSLTNTGVTLGSYGSASKTLTLTVDVKGRITTIAAPNIAIIAAQVTDFTSAALTAIGKTNNATGWSLAGGTISKTLTLTEDSTIDQDLQMSATPTFGGATLNGILTINTTASPQIEFYDTLDVDGSGSIKYLLDAGIPSLRIQSFNTTSEQGQYTFINPLGGKVSLGLLGTVTEPPFDVNMYGEVATFGKFYIFGNNSLSNPYLNTVNEDYPDKGMGWGIEPLLDGGNGIGFLFNADFDPVITGMKFFINPFGGNVGIGVTDVGTPAPVANYPLHVHGQQGIETQNDEETKLFLFDIATPLQQLRLGYNTAGDYGVLQAMNNVTPSNLILNPNSGNVGIGALTTPLTKLHVLGDAITAQFDSNATMGSQFMARGSTTATKQAWFGIDTTDNVGILLAVNAGISNLPMMINPYGGSVGIGYAPNTVLPDSTLAVSHQIICASRISAQAGWLAGVFGASGSNQVVMGVLNGAASIGGHNSTLTAWGDFHINPGAIISGVKVGVGLFVSGGQTANATLHSAGSTIFGVATTAIADANIYNNQVNTWYDESNSRLVFKAKNSSGVVTSFPLTESGGSSPLTTKGDLYTFTTEDARLAVGATFGQFLTVDAAQATGLAWSSALTLNNISTPSAPTAANKIYSKSDNETYSMMPSGVEIPLTYAKTRSSTTVDSNGPADSIIGLDSGPGANLFIVDVANLKRPLTIIWAQGASMPQFQAAVGQTIDGSAAAFTFTTLGSNVTIAPIPGVANSMIVTALRGTIV